MVSLIRFHYVPLTGFDRLLEDAFHTRLWVSPLVRGRRATTGSQRFDSFRPRTDLEVSEDSNTVTATFELPGLKPDDVSIDLHQDRLTVSGESATSDSRDGDGYSMLERRHGKFSGTLQLPSGTKASRRRARVPEDVKAKLEHGLLTVTFPKNGPEQQPQRIAVE